MFLEEKKKEIEENSLIMVIIYIFIALSLNYGHLATNGGNVFKLKIHFKVFYSLLGFNGL